jgi:hypothetical protein
MVAASRDGDAGAWLGAAEASLLGGALRAQAIDIGHTAAVAGRRRSPLNLNVLLGAVEAAPPVAAAEVVGDALSEALGTRDVSFLIADYSGRSLIRLSHLYEWGQRSLRLSLEAEIQHRLLPGSYT